MSDTIQVWAANEDIRRVLKHPTAGGFRHDITMPVAWPRDPFTFRRLAEGRVLDKQPQPAAQAFSAAQAPAAQSKK